MNLQEKIRNFQVWGETSDRKLIVANWGFKTELFDDLKTAYRYFDIFRDIYADQNLKNVVKMDFEKFCDILLYDDEDHNFILLHTNMKNTVIKIQIQKIRETIYGL